MRESRAANNEQIKTVQCGRIKTVLKNMFNSLDSGLKSSAVNHFSAAVSPYKVRDLHPLRSMVTSVLGHLGLFFGGPK